MTEWKQKRQELKEALVLACIKGNEEDFKNTTQKAVFWNRLSYENKECERIEWEYNLHRVQDWGAMNLKLNLEYEIQWLKWMQEELGGEGGPKDKLEKIEIAIRILRVIEEAVKDRLKSSDQWGLRNKEDWMELDRFESHAFQILDSLWNGEERRAFQSIVEKMKREDKKEWRELGKLEREWFEDLGWNQKEIEGLQKWEGNFFKIGRARRILEGWFQEKKRRKELELSGESEQGEELNLKDWEKRVKERQIQEQKKEWEARGFANASVWKKRSHWTAKSGASKGKVPPIFWIREIEKEEKERMNEENLRGKSKKKNWDQEEGSRIEDWVRWIESIEDYQKNKGKILNEDISRDDKEQWIERVWFKARNIEDEWIVKDWVKKGKIPQSREVGLIWDVKINEEAHENGMECNENKIEELKNKWMDEGRWDLITWSMKRGLWDLMTELLEDEEMVKKHKSMWKQRGKESQVQGIYAEIISADLKNMEYEWISKWSTEVWIKEERIDRKERARRLYEWKDKGLNIEGWMNAKDWLCEWFLDWDYKIELGGVDSIGEKKKNEIEQELKEEVKMLRQLGFEVEEESIKEWIQELNGEDTIKRWFHEFVCRLQQEAMESLLKENTVPIKNSKVSKRL